MEHSGSTLYRDAPFFIGSLLEPIGVNIVIAANAADTTRIPS